MNTAMKTLVAFIAGAAAMYCMDPVAGRRRRAMALDQGAAAGRRIKHYAGAKSKRAANRTKGLLAKTRARLENAPVDDATLEARIRSKLGRLIEHPAALDVEVREGRVTLAGRSLAALDKAIETVSAMPGVESVDYRSSRRVDGRAGMGGHSVHG